MGSSRWRIAVAILGGTGWGWILILPKLREMAVNPSIHPTGLWLGLLAICLVLLVIDVGAIWYWLNGSDSVEDEYADDDSRAAHDEAQRRSSH